MRGPRALTSTSRKAPKLTYSDCELSVNALLPPDIAIYHLQRVDEKFHARFSALSRRYRYYMCPRKRPLLFKRVWMVFYKIDWERVHEESLPALPGRTISARSAHGQRRAPRTLYGDGCRDLPRQTATMKVFTIEADRFVYTMVRSIIGTLVDIGQGTNHRFDGRHLAGKDRRRAGMTAPACGLVLDNVFYEGVD